MDDGEAEYTFAKMDEHRARWVAPRVYRPPHDLSRYLDACFITESIPMRSPHERVRRMPEGATYIVFLRGRRTLTGIRDEAKLVVGGAHDCVHDIPTWDYELQCGLRIQPGAARLVLGLSAAVVRNCIVPLRELWGERADVLLEQLVVASSDAAWLRLLCDAVREVLARESHTGLLAVRFARALRSAPGDARLSVLAREFGVSVRTLERRFQDSVGMGPKQYQRVARIAKVLMRLNENGGNWSRIASACGYYDQSHLSDDCHGVLGRPPERFLRDITNVGSLEIGLVFEKSRDR
ncbi:MAG: helix-turn-helix domain-containing protein [Myxococcota bacterium]